MHAATSAKKQKEYIDTLQAEIDVLEKKIGSGGIIDSAMR